VRFGGTDRTHVTAPTLLDLIDALWSHRLVLIVLLVLSGVGGYEAGTTVGVKYQSQAVLETTDARNLVGVFGNQAPGAGTSPTEIAALATSAATRDKAAAAAGGTVDLKNITATSAKDNSVTVAVTTGDPVLAARFADAVAEAVVQQRRDGLRAELGRISSTLRGRADALDGEVTKLEGEVAAARGQIAGDRAPGRVLGPTELAAVAAKEEQARFLELRREQLRTSQQQFRNRADELDIETGRNDVGVVIVTRATPAADVTLPKPWHLAVLGPLITLLGVMAIIYVRLSFQAAYAGRERRTGLIAPPTGFVAPPTHGGGDGA